MNKQNNVVTDISNSVAMSNLHQNRFEIKKKDDKHAKK